jgi:2,3-dihydroxybenzoate decarboxylase
MDGKIAVEEHFSTEVTNKLWAAKGEEDRNGRDYTRDIERRLLDPDLCVRGVDRADIDFCVKSLTSPGVQSVVDPKYPADLTRSANDYAKGFVKKHATRLSAFAAVAMQDPKGVADDELDWAVNEFGFKGALING